MNTDKLYNELIELEYEARYGNDTYKAKVIDSRKEARNIFRVALAEALSEKFSEYEAKIAKLEAKVYAYEAIIANSNFKPLLEGSIRVDLGSQDDKTGYSILEAQDEN